VSRIATAIGGHGPEAGPGPARRAGLEVLAVPQAAGAGRVDHFAGPVDHVGHDEAHALVDHELHRPGRRALDLVPVNIRRQLEPLREILVQLAEEGAGACAADQADVLFNAQGVLRREVQLGIGDQVGHQLVAEQETGLGEHRLRHEDRPFGPHGKPGEFGRIIDNREQAVDIAHIVRKLRVLSLAGTGTESGGLVLQTRTGIQLIGKVGNDDDVGRIHDGSTARRHGAELAKVVEELVADLDRAAVQQLLEGDAGHHEVGIVRVPRDDLTRGVGDGDGAGEFRLDGQVRDHFVHDHAHVGCGGLRVVLLEPVRVGVVAKVQPGHVCNEVDVEVVDVLNQTDGR